MATPGPPRRRRTPRLSVFSRGVYKGPTSKDGTTGVVGQRDAGGDAFADRLALRFEALADGHDDLQAVLAHPAGVRGPGDGQYRVGVPHRDLDHVAGGDPQVQQHRPRGVLAGVGDQLADDQLDEVHGALRDGQTVVCLDAGEEIGGQVAGLGDDGAVAVQRRRGLDGLSARRGAVLSHGRRFPHSRLHCAVHPARHAPGVPLTDPSGESPRTTIPPRRGRVISSPVPRPLSESGLVKVVLPVQRSPDYQPGLVRGPAPPSKAIPFGGRARYGLAGSAVRGPVFGEWLCPWLIRIRLPQIDKLQRKGIDSSWSALHPSALAATPTRWPSRVRGHRVGTSLRSLISPH